MSTRSSRAILSAKVRAAGIRGNIPINKIYAGIYERVRLELGINLYREATLAGCKPMDIAEQKGIIGRMIEICLNMTYTGRNNQGTQELQFKEHQSSGVIMQDGHSIDTETGEIID